MDVVLFLGRQLVVNDQPYLMNVNSSSKKIGRNQNSTSSFFELLHHILSLFLRHASVNVAYNKIVLSHLLSQLLTLVFGVDVDEALVHIDVPENLDQILEFGVLGLARDEVLLNTLQCKILLLYQYLRWVVHDVLGQGDDFVAHGCREKTDLAVGWNHLDDLIDLLKESKSQHLVSLINDQHLQALGAQVPSVHHILNSSRSSYYYMAAFLQGLLVMDNLSSSSTQVYLQLQVDSKVQNYILDLVSQLSGWSHDQSLHGKIVLVNILKHSDCEGCGLTGSRLGLGNDVSLFDDREDSFLLDLGWVDESVPEDSSEEVLL